jgi:two-component system chemotaxis response regulator CheV
MAGILLESGTNELELLVFRVGGIAYGINVAKVRELIRRVPTIAVPHVPRGVAGSFKLREEVLTLIDLPAYLEMDPVGDPDYQLIIVIDLNNVRCGMLVEAVEMIHRLRWDQIDPPTKLLVDVGAPITAVARIEDRVIQILDFETVIGALLGRGGTEVVEHAPESPVGGHEAIRVLVVDDSISIRRAVERVLHNAGFQHITKASNGEEAWALLEAQKGESGLPFDIVLSDIEMPRMDGLHLTQRIKTDTKLKAMPVVLFSSIIRPDTRNKGDAVGADAQVTKFQSNELVETIDRILQVTPAPVIP